MHKTSLGRYHQRNDFLSVKAREEVCFQKRTCTFAPISLKAIIIPHISLDYMKTIKKDLDLSEEETF